MLDLKQARIDYESSVVSFRELGKTYGCSYVALCKRSKKEGWIKCKVDKDAKKMAQAEHAFIESRKELEKCDSLIEKSPAYVKAHVEEHRQISVKNRAEAIAAETRLKLAQQNSVLTDSLDVHGDDFAIQKHNVLVKANKNVDTSRQTGTTINNQQQNNLQINIFDDIAQQHNSIYESVNYDS